MMHALLVKLLKSITGLACRFSFFFCQDGKKFPPLFAYRRSHSQGFDCIRPPAFQWICTIITH